MTKQLKAWGLLLSLLTVTACTTVSQGGPVENSPRYIQAPAQDIINEWMTYRNGTITTSGPETYYYDGEETSAVDPTSTDMRYDMPGTHCFLTEDDMESASAYLHVSTALHYTAPINIDHELDKVANYWRSQGTTDITYSTVGKHKKDITATTPPRHPHNLRRQLPEWRSSTKPAHGLPLRQRIRRQ